MKKHPQERFLDVITSFKKLKTSQDRDAPFEGLLLMAKQVQSEHPASGSWTGGSIQSLDLGAYQQQHCAQGRDGSPGPRPIRAGWHRETETKEGDPGIRETQAGRQRGWSQEL